MVCEFGEPIVTFPKPTVDGVAVMAGCVPVPLNEIFVGDVGALLVIVMFPAGLPAEVGAKVAVIDELAPAATEIGNVNPLTEYPDPDAVIWLIVSGAFPVLEKEIVCAELLPNAIFPNATLLGLGEI
jgi:hypothetical protein